MYEVTATVKVAEYPRELMPLAGSAERLVFIGDIHGCNEEFAALLDKVEFQKGKDKLILLGDFISKGPDSIAVMELAMENDAACVRGNHENTLLRRYAKKHRMHFDNDDGDYDSAHGDNGGFVTIMADEKKIIKKATQAQIEYIDSCPLILTIPEKIFGEDHGDVSAVHAGLMWDVMDYEHQDPAVLLYMRTLLGPHNSTASPTRRGVLWKEVWNDFQELLPPVERRTVLYGHDAKTGLAIMEYSKGLDSRCYKGDYLTALVAEKDVEGNWTHEVISVKCAVHDPKLLPN
ncbi:Metallo-dependent phosphatase-like protein [Dipodascopsis tothii]|uniref:Metallo-dependent phosphatase-like protein n=1 Tax=Dipodascopsis tothii TaxID=44089 RepID=UPI0034CD27E0